MKPTTSATFSPVPSQIPGEPATDPHAVPRRRPWSPPVCTLVRVAADTDANFVVGGDGGIPPDTES